MSKYNTKSIIKLKLTQQPFISSDYEYEAKAKNIKDLEDEGNYTIYWKIINGEIINEILCIEDEQDACDWDKIARIEHYEEGKISPKNIILDHSIS